jgi:tetratricopeptide (TPR) repeat protein
LWAWADALRQQEKFDEAIDKFRLAVQIVPRDFRAVYYYGQSLAELGSYGDAIAQFDNASLLNSSSAWPYCSIALSNSSWFANSTPR